MGIKEKYVQYKETRRVTKNQKEFDKILPPERQKEMYRTLGDFETQRAKESLMQLIDRKSKEKRFP